MKKSLLLAALGLGAVTVNAQAIPDSALTGAGVSDQVYYSLANSIVKTQANNDWDLAFGATGMSSAVLFNTANGNKVYIVPGKTPANFASCDTAGLKNFTACYNSDTTWSIGALNQGSTSDTDLGWGEYDMVTHTVAGTKVYIAKYSTGAAKKFYIKDLVSGVYTIVIANIDGTAEQTVTVAKASYNTKNFGYLALTSGTVIDREPATASWDIVFTKYTTILMAPSPTPYGVTGVLSNKGVTVAEASKVNKATATYTGRNFATALNEIGYDWKAFDFNTNTYKITDSLCYFVKTKNGSIYKLIMTGFSGSASGKFYFTKEALVVTAIADAKGNNAGSMAIYPNPATTEATLVLNNESTATVANVQIFDLSGKMVSTENIAVNQGLTQHTTEASSLEAGMYVVQVTVGNSRLSSKLSIIK